MPKYLFITYGEAGWRGVQMRAVRIAQYLPKEEVLFWNMYDDSIIREWGYKVQKCDASLVHPAGVRLPPSVHVVIFADLPTNELLQYSVLKASQQQDVKIVVCDQLYRRGQTHEHYFQIISQQVDLVLLNSLSFLKTEETEKIKIFPPQIEKKFTKKTAEEVRKKYRIPPDYLILFGSGYHDKVRESITFFTQGLTKHYKKFCTLLSDPTVDHIIHTNDNVILTPFTTGDAYFDLLHASDITLVKFGFLQILESLALHKPTVVMGEPGQLLQDSHALDPLLRNALRLENDPFDYLHQLVTDPGVRQKVVAQIQKLHDGDLFGGKKAAEAILGLSHTKPKTKYVHPKRLAVLINEEILEYRDWIQKENVYPLGIIWSMPKEKEVIKRIPTRLLDKTIKDFQQKSGDLLPISFHHLFIFSPRKYDGIMAIDDWYETWIEQIESLMQQATVIYISSQGKKVMSTLLKSNSSMKKSRVINAKHIVS